ncbi:hypothetical protein [Ruegeria lacuscaerulensis]|uniref:hypothetical protein n=1 Tax=Ruegeria lacuscaerulensis TaxID=55218 RepID=UPI00147C1C1D|nr:hypothetical protein [Ruegeria lacuscaerulensis]
MKAIPAILIALLPTQSLAQEDPIRGRFLCEVLSNRFVPSDNDRTVSDVGHPMGHLPGSTFIVDYTLEPESGLTIFLGEPNRTNVLIEEPFPTSSFKGISKITNKAEYRSTFSEFSLGKYSVNYKGNDQLSIKSYCGAEWSGFYVQTYASGLYTQVVSLTCRPFVDATAELLDRLKLHN